MKLPHSPWEAEEWVSTPASGQGHPASHRLPAPMLGQAPRGPAPCHGVGAGEGRKLAKKLGGREAGTGHGLAWDMAWGHRLAWSWVGMGHGVAGSHVLALVMGRHGPWDGTAWAMGWHAAQDGMAQGLAQAMSWHAAGLSPGWQEEAACGAQPPARP